MTIFYKFGEGLYVNVTNRCPCDCVFCIRQNGDCVGDSQSLWLEREPTVEEIISDFEKTDKTGCSEVVFCGYGEPLVRLDAVLEVCKFIRKNSDMKIRINTNGLSDLIHGKPTAQLLEGRVDTVSVSLNASSKKEYVKLTRPAYGKRPSMPCSNSRRTAKNTSPTWFLRSSTLYPRRKLRPAACLPKKRAYPCA